jgi:nitroreductase
MELKEAIESRRSIRGYRTDPVPKDVLKNIIETSLRAPSAMNVQPWEITVVTGKALEEIRKGTVERLSTGETPVHDLGHAKPFEGIHKERQRALGLGLYSLLGITREDKQKRMEWTMVGFRSFDAPASIILSADESLEPRMAAADIGGIVQTICLVALEHGLGTCINGQGIMCPDVVRKAIGLPESKNMYISIAIGYPDGEHPSNNLISDRESVDNVVSWVGFD